MPRALNIVVVEEGHARVHGALSLAVAAAALGRPVSLFFQGPAVRALAKDQVWPEDSAFQSHGAPTVQELLLQCEDMAVPLSACETGLHVTGLGASGLRPGIETEGMISFLARQADADLLTI